MEENRTMVMLGARVPRKLQGKILAEQQRIMKTTGIKPSINDVVQMLLEKGLEANGKKR